MNSLVITTVNPYGNIKHQKLCFEKWKTIGYKILSFNSLEESERLINSGFSKNDIFILDHSDTALGLFGKPIPRILPVLNRATNELNFENYLLVNADIYPAHRKSIVSFLRTINSCIVFTRNDTISLETHLYTDSFPYRGGLDIFFFTHDALNQLFNKLIGIPVSERMTFGIPGWDFYLSHIILEMGGTMMDGQVFLHQRHPVTYSDTNEFQYYVDEMKKSNEFKNIDPNELVVEYSNLIHKNCEANQQFSKQLKTIYYQSPLLKKSNEQIIFENNIENCLLLLLKKQGMTFSFSTELKAFISHQRDAINWHTAELFRKKKLNCFPIMEISLIMLLIQLLIKKQNKRKCLSITYQYPQNNQHGLALRQIIENTSGDEREHHLFILFASELSEYSIFNTQLFKYLVLISKTKKSLSICTALLSICLKG